VKNKREIEIDHKTNLFLRRVDLDCGVLFRCVPDGTRNLREKDGGGLFNYYLRGLCFLLFDAVRLAEYAPQYLSCQFDSVSRFYEPLFPLGTFSILTFGNPLHIGDGDRNVGTKNSAAKSSHTQKFR